MDKYIFPALFEKGETKGYVVSFPDLPGCITEGDNIEEAIQMAKEALELHLYNMEEDSECIPSPTSPEKVQLPEDSFVSIVEVWMPVVRDSMENRAATRQPWDQT